MKCPGHTLVLELEDKKRVREIVRHSLCLENFHWPHVTTAPVNREAHRIVLGGDLACVFAFTVFKSGTFRRVGLGFTSCEHPPNVSLVIPILFLFGFHVEDERRPITWEIQGRIAAFGQRTLPSDFA